VTYLLGRWRQTFAVDLGEERRQIAASKTPMERRRSSLVVSLKSEQPLFEFGQRRDVVGGENLPLDYREEDLDLVEPTGMDRGVDEKWHSAIWTACGQRLSDLDERSSCP